MNQNSTWQWVALIAVAIIAVIALSAAFAGKGQTAGDIGSSTNYDKLGVSEFKLGTGCGSAFRYANCTGSKISKVLRGTCNLTQNSPGSFVASSTALFFCPVTGVAANDQVFATLPAGAGLPASLVGGFHLVSAFATTSNQVGFILSNDTAAATSSFTQATTGVAYWIVD